MCFPSDDSDLSFYQPKMWNKCRHYFDPSRVKVLVFRFDMIFRLICQGRSCNVVAEKHFSHGRCQLWRPWKKTNETLPKSTHDFSISASVFSFFFFLFSTPLFVFSCLLGPELLTSGSAAWCFLAAVKFHRSQLSSTDTFFLFFFFLITQIFMHGPSVSMTRLWPRHSPSRRRTPTSARREAVQRR